MYKVFFNDSSIQLSSEVKKSSNNNIVHWPENDDYAVLNQMITSIEASSSEISFVLQCQDVELVWSKFKRRFVEIPAAGGFVRNRNNEFLFIRRLGYWDLPKGKIEKKESPEYAAIREVEEECGLSGLYVVRKLDSTFHLYRSPYLKAQENLVMKETQWFLMDYSGNETPVPQITEDIEEVRWFHFSELDWVTTQTYLSLQDFIQKTIAII